MVEQKCFVILLLFRRMILMLIIGLELYLGLIYIFLIKKSIKFVEYSMDIVNISTSQHLYSGHNSYYVYRC